MNKNRIFNIFNLKLWLSALLFSIILISCEKQLEENLYDTVLLDNYYQTEGDIMTGLAGMYSLIVGNGWQTYNLGGEVAYFACETPQTDIILPMNNWLVNPGDKVTEFYNFNPDSRNPIMVENWREIYRAIAVANSLFEYVPNATDVDTEFINEILAEARAFRALKYSRLYFLWGNVPLITSTPNDLTEPTTQASKEEIKQFVEDELIEAIKGLPDVNYIDNGDPRYHSRLTKAGVQAILAKFYLNTKQWDKCAELCETIINNPNYALYEGDYFDLFAVNNDAPGPSSEMLVVLSSIPQNLDRGCHMAQACFMPAMRYYPPNGDSIAPTFYSGLGRWFVDGDFYNTFDAFDLRRRGLVQTWENVLGKVTTYNDRAVIIKWEPQTEGAGEWHSLNNISIIRMADIYLARAECLNELNGPTQEAIDLINAVRARAFEPDQPISLGDFTQETLKDHILQERGWELYTENHRRQDLIRHGKLLDIAKERGAVNPTEDLYLFPIPYDGVISINPSIQQNPGY